MTRPNENVLRALVDKSDLSIFCSLASVSSGSVLPSSPFSLSESYHLPKR